MRTLVTLSKEAKRHLEKAHGWVQAALLEAQSQDLVVDDVSQQWEETYDALVEFFDDALADANGGTSRRRRSHAVGDETPEARRKK